MGEHDERGSRGSSCDAVVRSSLRPATRCPRRVLIVDDNHDAADMLGDFLTVIGHEVRVVYDGRDAVSALHQFAAQVVLLDIGLPELDGWQVARQLREIHESPRLCIIAVTGYGEDRDRQRSRSAGIDHHLVKPPDLKALERLMQSSSEALGG